MTNLDAHEREQFAKLAASWWDPEGPTRTLHDINACRLDYICRDRSLVGLRIADIGCGGGILSEALARAGAHVVAVDASAELIDIARTHARADNLPIDYRPQLVEELVAQEGNGFDLVTCMELIEHVPDPGALIEACAQLLKGGGELVVSTLNRTPSAYALGIVMAEYVLNLVPRGTHDYAQFLTPAELARIARARGLQLQDVSGMHYNPLTRRARVAARPLINYFARFAKDAEIA